MMTYMDLSITARGFLSLWFDLLLLFACMTAFQMIYFKKYALSVPAIIVAVAGYYLVQWCVYISKSYDKGFVPTCEPKLFGEMSWTTLVYIGIPLTAVIVSLFIYARQWSKTHLTVNSIKEGMDNLPSGLCWFQEDGTVVMRNLVMEQLCRKLTGARLGDGILLRDTINNRMDEKHVMTLSDGTAWSVSMDMVEVVDGSQLYEICAYDITKEYETTRILTNKKLEAQEANEKLTRYSRELAQMITAGEILAAKVRIHDELGKGLLLTRKYLLRESSKEDKEKLLYVLRKNVTLMECTGEEANRSYLDMILEAASDMGVKLVINGSLPQTESLKDIMLTAIHENLTNTIRHAQGNEMQVDIEYENKLCKAVFVNNGIVPKSPVEERGGLAMLRTLVEAANGKMTIEHNPKYRMTLCFEMEE